MSDTRTQNDDTSGQIIRELLDAAGHTVCSYAIIRDEPALIREQIAAAIKNPGCQAILLNGGTGIAPRDQTVETITALLDKKLDGFGEIFRMLSYQEIGPAAMMSRAVAGVHAGRVIFSMPGSPNAVRLAMTKLIVPQLGHLVYELTKQ